MPILQSLFLIMMFLTSHVVAQTESLRTRETAAPQAAALPLQTKDASARASSKQAVAPANETASSSANALEHASELNHIFQTSQPRQVREVYKIASLILNQDNSCSRFFGSERVTEVLDQLVSRIKPTLSASALGIRMSGTITVIKIGESGLTYRVFDKVEVNRAGAFFNAKRFPNDARVPGVGSFAPATSGARVLMVLHELGHMVMGTNGKSLLPDDGNNVSLSSKNTATIESECGEQIRAFNRPRNK